MELVRVDRREVLLGPQAREVDGVLAVGEDLLVLARFGLALAPRVRRNLREPRGAALVVLPLVALGRRERRDQLLVPVWKSTSATGARLFFTKSPRGDDAADLAPQPTTTRRL